jgi:hypothetical protein
MKKVLNILLVVVVLLSSCESGTKITGVLSGDDASGFSEIQAFVNNTPLLEKPATVTNGKFTLKLPAVPAELTSLWQNKDGSEHVRLAEAEIVIVDNNVSINPYILHEERSDAVNFVYRFIYADRDANMSGWFHNSGSRFFNWIIPAWIEQSNFHIDWDGILKKGWNAVSFSGKRVRYPTEERIGNAKVEPLPENVVWQTATTVSIKPPPTGVFNGTISVVTDYKTIDMSYDRFDVFKKTYWTISSIDGKCRIKLPDPPQDKMESFTGLWNLLYKHGFNRAVSSFEYSVGGHKVNVAEMTFAYRTRDIFNKDIFHDIHTYYNNDKVFFVYSTADFIVTGGFYYQSLSGYDEVNLHFKKGWNTVLLHITDRLHRTLKTAEINGEVEFR